jgi:response regulator RpfG family c-di-GMP phosphodiesterase
MNRRVLFVDDDLDILSAFRRNLRKHFLVKTADNANAAIEIMKENPPFACIVSDYRMPGMDGIEFLTLVKKLSPDSVRIIITGFADLETAIAAVNKGNIYRFLTKPVPTGDVISTLTDATELYRLITSEKQLLNQTLKGSIKILIDMLSAVNPDGFAHSSGIHKLARRIAERLNMKNTWEVEIAALLSHIGAVTLPQDIVEKKYYGYNLSKEENRIFNSQADFGAKLLANIPRLEEVAEAIRFQFMDFKLHGSKTEDGHIIDIPMIARILKVVNDYMDLSKKGKTDQAILVELINKVGSYDNSVLAALKEELLGGRGRYIVRSMPFKQLRIGMILADDIKDLKENKLVNKGQEVTDVLLMRLISTSKVRGIKEPVLVMVDEG